MKVLLVADAVGGVFTYAVELARALAARGVSIVLATEGARLAPDQRAALDGVDGLVHEEGAFALEWMAEPWKDVAAAGRWLLEIERRERPDLVHLNVFAHGTLPFRAPKLVVGHSCVLSWFEAVKGHAAPPEWKRYRVAVSLGLRAAHAVAAPTAWMADALVRHHGPIARPVVVPNGRDAARFPPGAKESFVLGAGRLWDEAKNAAALHRVAPRLAWPVFIAGETATPTAASTPPHPDPLPRGAGEREDRGGRDSTATSTPTSTATSTATSTPTATATAAATRSGDPFSLSPRGAGREGRGEGGREATLLGRLPEAELARWLGRAAIFAHPARYEPFGLAVLEAALAGCALVLGDLPSLRETWAGAAELVPPGDDDALARAIDALAADGGRREALARAARERALGFSPARMAEGYLALYRALLERRAAAGARP